MEKEPTRDSQGCLKCLLVTDTVFQVIYWLLVAFVLVAIFGVGFMEAGIWGPVTMIWLGIITYRIVNNCQLTCGRTTFMRLNFALVFRAFALMIDFINIMDGKSNLILTLLITAFDVTTLYFLSEERKMLLEDEKHKQHVVHNQKQPLLNHDTRV